MINCLSVSGQNFAIRSKAENVMINNNSYNGFTATVDFPFKAIRKEFKEFSKGFSKYTAHKKYSRLEIKPNSKDQDTSLEMLVMFENKAEKTRISTALEVTEMSTSERNQYVKLPDNTLREFQIYYYQKWMQQRIASLETHLIKLGKQEISLTKRESGIKNKIKPLTEQEKNALRQKLAKLKLDQKSTQSQIDNLKTRFKEIK